MNGRASCIAVDIGASSGKMVWGSYTRGTLSFKPVYRFDNTPLKTAGGLVWNIDELQRQILAGLSKRVLEIAEPRSVGIDTWAVDYVILDDKGERKTPCHSYRDERTSGIPESVFGKISPLELYMKTGIQIQRFNSLFQLVAESRHTVFSTGDRFLMVPDYLHYALTGEMTNEATNLSTTQCCLAGTSSLDAALLGLTGLTASNFPRLVESGVCVGSVPKEKAAQNPRLLGLRVIAPPTHDTAAAVCAIPSEEAEPLFISSGTWTLMGVELARPILSEAAFRANFSNEAGHGGRICFLKNIMGLWLLQRMQRELPDALSFSDMEELARQSGERFRSVINPQDDRFLNPSSMKNEIVEYCRSYGEPIPDTPQRLVRCAYDSLCLAFATTLEEIVALTGKKFSRVHMIGGGCRDELLCQLTADLTGLEVVAGPSEASAVGNCLTQFIAQGAIRSLAEGRALLRESIPSKTYYPRPDAETERLKDRFMAIAP